MQSTHCGVRTSFTCEYVFKLSTCYRHQQAEEFFIFACPFWTLLPWWNACALYILPFVRLSRHSPVVGPISFSQCFVCLPLSLTSLRGRQILQTIQRCFHTDIQTRMAGSTTWQENPYRSDWRLGPKQFQRINIMEAKRRRSGGCGRSKMTTSRDTEKDVRPKISKASQALHFVIPRGTRRSRNVWSNSKHPNKHTYRETYWLRPLQLLKYIHDFIGFENAHSFESAKW